MGPGSLKWLDHFGHVEHIGSRLKWMRHLGYFERSCWGRSQRLSNTGDLSLFSNVAHPQHPCPLQPSDREGQLQRVWQLRNLCRLDHSNHSGRNM